MAGWVAITEEERGTKCDGDGDATCHNEAKWVFVQPARRGWYACDECVVVHERV